MEFVVKSRERKRVGPLAHRATLPDAGLAMDLATKLFAEGHERIEIYMGDVLVATRDAASLWWSVQPWATKTSPEACYAGLA